MQQLPWVISVDDHVVEPPTVWSDRLPSAIREREPRVVQDRCETIIEPRSKVARYVKGGDGPIVDWWVYEDVLRPIPQVMACAGFPPESLTLQPLPFAEMRRGCFDRDARLADMDVNRTERSLCFPTFPRFAGQLFLEARDKTVALESVRAYNDWMIDEWCGPSHGRLIPLCLVPLWDPVLAAAEVRRNAARGCHAVAFTELPANLGLPSLHDADRHWDPFLAACDETRTTINMHIGSGSRMPTTSADAPSGVGIALTSLNAYMAMADWLLSGVMARFANLKIAFSESQVGWMPFLLERLDHLYTKSKAWADLDPSLTDLPSSYVPGRVYGCFFDDMVGVDARHQIGIGQLVFETDYPHQDSTWPHTVDLVAKIAERVTPAELEMLVRTNAIDMLHLDPADLRPMMLHGDSDAMNFDIVVRNGRVVDGSGLGSYRADVGISEGRIVTIGRIRERGATDIDAEGHVITPGFIDGHTHLDAQVFWDPLGANDCWHGITTAVMGNCGFTLAPAAPEARALVVRNLERAEDISGAAMAAGIDWSWTTFAEYLDAVDQLPKGINYAANIGHSALRTYVMGERAFEEEATRDDLAAMTRELLSSLQAGAYGFTTSRTRHHQTSDDRPVASRVASWAEVCALVRVLGEANVGTFQFVEDSPPPDERAAHHARLIALAAETGVPFAIGATSDADRVLPLLDVCVDAGGRMFGLGHCRGIGTLSSFRTQLPFDRLPEWRELRSRPLDEQRRMLTDRSLVARLAQIALAGPYPDAFGGEARPPDFARMQVLERPVPPNPTVAEAARVRGVDPVTYLIDRALESDLAQFFVQTNAPFDYDDVARILRHPQTVMAFSDAGAHVSQMSDASLPTHLLAHWVRDRGDFTIEEAIRMLTLEPARAWGFHDRGLLREGLVADCNIIDLATVAPAMPTVVHDLPAGEKRIDQRATGFLATIVGGQVTQRDGEPTGALPGRLLRGPLACR